MRLSYIYLLIKTVLGSDDNLFIENKYICSPSKLSYDEEKCKSFLFDKSFEDFKAKSISDSLKRKNPKLNDLQIFDNLTEYQSIFENYIMKYK